MESDFVTRQHFDSLVPHNDPSIAETLNKYKFPPANPNPAPQQHTQQMGGYAPYFGGAPSNNEIFLGAMLGQIQASVQNKTKDSDGFQLNVSNEVLKWVFVILLVAILVWIIFHISRKEKKPLQRRLRKLEKKYRKLKKLKKAKRKNPKSLPDTEPEDPYDIDGLDPDYDLDDDDDYDD